MSVSLETAEKNEREAWASYWKIKKQAPSLRTTFLEQQAKDIARDKGLEEKNVYQQLLTRERQRKDARKIKFALKKMNAGSVTTLETKVHGRTVEIIDRSAVEKACIQENREKYSQALNTICMKEPLRSLLGLYGETDFSLNLLLGQAAIPPTLPNYTKEFLQHLQLDPNTSLDEIKPSVTQECFSQGWSKMKEKTATISSFKKKNLVCIKEKS